MHQLDMDRSQLRVLSGEFSHAIGTQRYEVLDLATRLAARHVPSWTERTLEIDREARPGGDPLHWREWHDEHAEESMAHRGAGLMQAIDQLRDALASIDEATVQRYVRDYLVTPIYLGAEVRAAVFMRVAEELRLSYDLAEPGSGIDGTLEERPIVLWPLALRERIRPEDRSHGVIYFEPHDDGLRLFLDL